MQDSKMFRRSKMRPPIYEDKINEAFRGVGGMSREELLPLAIEMVHSILHKGEIKEEWTKLVPEEHKTDNCQHVRGIIQDQKRLFYEGLANMVKEIPVPESEVTQMIDTFELATEKWVRKVGTMFNKCGFNLANMVDQRLPNEYFRLPPGYRPFRPKYTSSDKENVEPDDDGKFTKNHKLKKRNSKKENTRKHNKKRENKKTR